MGVCSIQSSMYEEHLVATGRWVCFDSMCVWRFTSWFFSGSLDWQQVIPALSHTLLTEQWRIREGVFQAHPYRSNFHWFQGKRTFYRKICQNRGLAPSPAPPQSVRKLLELLHWESTLPMEWLHWESTLPMEWLRWESTKYPTNGVTALGKYPTNGVTALGKYPTNGVTALGKYPTNGVTALGKYPTNGVTALGKYPTNGVTALGKYLTNASMCTST